MVYDTQIWRLYHRGGSIVETPSLTAQEGFPSLLDLLPGFRAFPPLRFMPMAA